ncbi:DUF1501 domain-containing protein [Hyphomonas chukchiensis]|uniref:DUF1501 domain-containing protein n=1 Tax=Hyphomonas chukchiensis TaxID=1280947 RepID=UPI0030F6703D
MAKMNRRHFLQAGAATSFLAGTGVLSTLTSGKAFAADTSGYKALVCIFLKGGMDHADTVIPRDQASYDLLRNARPGLYGAYGVGSGSSSRDRANLLPLNPTNAASFGSRQYGLPSQLAGFQSMFESGEMAIVGNVGPLIQPTTRPDLEKATFSLPPRLFSHNDQQSTWMSLGVEGSQYGWGGAFADAAIRSNSTMNPLYAMVSAGPNDVFLSGTEASQFTTSYAGAQQVKLVDDIYTLGGESKYDAARRALDDYVAKASFSEDNLYARDYISQSGNAVINNNAYDAALSGKPGLTATFPASYTAQQLSSVARTISIRDALNTKRQVFYVFMGSFDTHSGQTGQIPDLHTELSEAVSAFRTEMINQGVWNDVTLFTMSEFGRTTIDNGDGTDHGWGGHHFVAGGSVAGKKIYGDIPTPDLGSDTFTSTHGRLIPKVSVEQYAATLGSWFGLDSTELAAALPNLSNFSEKNLGFLT